MTSDDGLYLGVDVGTAAALWPVTAENPESPVPLDALSRNIAGCIWLTGWIRYLLGSLIHPGSRIHPVNPPARTAAGPLAPEGPVRAGTPAARCRARAGSPLQRPGGGHGPHSAPFSFRG